MWICGFTQTAIRPSGFFGGKMGRIDAVLDDKLEDRFRLEVAKRYGMRKGSLGKAIAEAVDAWTVTSEDKTQARKIAGVVLDPKAAVGVRTQAVDTLASMGQAGVKHLTDISSDGNVPDSIREQALKAIRAHASGR